MADKHKRLIRQLMAETGRSYMSILNDRERGRSRDDPWPCALAEWLLMELPVVCGRECSITAYSRQSQTG